MNHSFIVSPEVLIPRPETELLVEKTYQLAKNLENTQNESNLKLLDVGTGSGCIALSLAYLEPNWEITGWDISESALSIAKQNSQQLNLTSVSFFQLDASLNSTWKQGELYDIIVSNPPYIDFNEEKNLPVQVAKYEPKVALFSERNGLEFYHQFANQAFNRLKKGGYIVIEIGDGMSNKVVSIFSERGWKNCMVYSDYSGIKRVVLAQSPH